MWNRHRMAKEGSIATGDGQGLLTAEQNLSYSQHALPFPALLGMDKPTQP